MKTTSFLLKVIIWPRNDTNRRGAYPWFIVAWRAPFMFAYIALIYLCAAACSILVLAYAPRHSGDTFKRITESA